MGSSKQKVEAPVSEASDVSDPNCYLQSVGEVDGGKHICSKWFRSRLLIQPGYRQTYHHSMATHYVFSGVVVQRGNKKLSSDSTMIIPEVS